MDIIWICHTKIIRNGAVTLPIRAKNPQVPIAAPRQIVGNSSELYKTLAANVDSPTALATSDNTVTIISERNFFFFK